MVELPLLRISKISHQASKARPISRWFERLPSASSIILLLAVLVYLGFTFQWHLRLVDDAFITFRFAQQVASGQGFTWNAGGVPVEGFTSILHVLLLALGIKVGIRPETGSLIIGITSALLTVGLLTAILRRQFGVIPPIGAAVLGLYLVDKTTAVHSTSGLETTLFVALLCLSYFAALRFLEAPGWRVAILMAFPIFLSVLGRPEGVLYGATLYAVLFAYFGYRKWKFGDGKRGLLLLAASASLLVSLGLAYAIWKFSYFGYLLPNSYYVKSNRVSLDGLSEVAYFFGHVLLWFAPLIALGLAFSIFLWIANKKATLPGTAQSLPKILLTLLPALIGLAYYVTITHEVGFAHRFSYPTYFYLALSTAAFLSLLTRSVPTTAFSRTGLSVAVVGLFVLQGAWLQGIYRTQAEWPAVLPEHSTQQYHFKIAQALQGTGLGSQATVITAAAGVIPYVSGFNHVDPIGLTDNFMSGRQATTSEQREEYLWSRQADVYVGFEPPAQADIQRPEDDPRMDTLYVTRLMGRERNVPNQNYLKEPEILHFRMRELRDNWHLLGETESPNWKWLGLKSFVYVRKDSPHFERLASSLRPIVSVEPDEIDLDRPPETFASGSRIRTLAAQLREVLTERLLPRY